jgi:hypothetical protein
MHRGLVIGRMDLKWVSDTIRSVWQICELRGKAQRVLFYLFFAFFKSFTFIFVFIFWQDWGLNWHAALPRQVFYHLIHTSNPAQGMETWGMVTLINRKSQKWKHNELNLDHIVSEILWNTQLRLRCSDAQQRAGNLGLCIRNEVKKWRCK